MVRRHSKPATWHPNRGKSSQTAFGVRGRPSRSNLVLRLAPAHPEAPQRVAAASRYGDRSSPIALIRTKSRLIVPNPA